MELLTRYKVLTVKSDDINGRNRMYESIVKGVSLRTWFAGSFKVLMQDGALALNVTL